MINKDKSWRKYINDVCQMYGFPTKPKVIDGCHLVINYDGMEPSSLFASTQKLIDDLKAILQSKLHYRYHINVDMDEEAKTLTLTPIKVVTGNKFHCKSKKLKPKRSTPGSAGYDFFSPKDFTVPAHGVSEAIDTNVSVELGDGYVLMCYVRSSFGFKYLTTLANGTGIIDSDFHPNTIKCKLKNDGDEDLVIHKGDKFMQGIFMRYSLEDGEDTSNMTARVGGIGSTGSK